MPNLRLTAPLWLYVGYLLMGTLYPFEFDPGPILLRLPEFTQNLQRGPSVFFTEDFLSNILLFIPFGIIVSLHFPARWRKGRWSVVATVLLACLLSSLIEFAQLFVRNRHSSLTDIVSNVLGALAGSLVIRFWPRPHGRHLASLIRLKGAWPVVLGLSLLLAWLPAAFPVVVPNWFLPGLWATDVTLNAGNNPSLTRPWYGSLHRVAIYARALDPVRAHECFVQTNEGKPVSPQADEKPLALYEFEESKAAALLDRTGGGADLHVEGTGRFRLRPNHGGLLIRHPARLSTGSGPGKQISTSLLKSREFSLEAWITPRNLIQRGPALIVDLAGLGDNTNLLLGQSTKDLVFWVRTPVSGPTLTALSVRTTNQPLTRSLTHVIAVFRDGRLELFVNGVRSGSLDLRREAMIGLPARHTDGARVAYAFFYFFPFTLFWSSLLARRRVGKGAWLAWLAAIAFLSIGEVVQAASAERPFDRPLLLLGIAVISVAAVVARLSSPIPRSE